MYCKLWTFFWDETFSGVSFFRLSVTHLNEVISLLCLQWMYISHRSYNFPVCVSFHNYIFASQVSGFVFFILFRCQTWTWHSSQLRLKNDNIHTSLVSSLLTSSPCLSSSASRTCSACGPQGPLKPLLRHVPGHSFPCALCASAPLYLLNISCYRLTVFFTTIAWMSPLPA